MEEGGDSPCRVAFGVGAAGNSLRIRHPDKYTELCWEIEWTAGAIEWAFGLARRTTVADNGGRTADHISCWPHFSFKGHWPPTELGQAVKGALTATLTMPDPAKMPFLGIEGLSGSAFRVFLNRFLSSLPGAQYLELGVGIGSAMASALHGNRISAIGIDDFSESVSARSRLWDNLAIVDVENCSFAVIEKPFDELALDDYGPFDVVFYDGPVTVEAAFHAISVATTAVKDVAVYIFDDWNAPEIREAYRRLIAAGRVREMAAIDIRTTLDNSHPSFYGTHSGWHNGYKLALLERQHIPCAPKPLLPTTMSEAGARISTIETATTFEWRASVQLGDDFPHAAAFGSLGTTASLNSYSLTNVIFSFVTMLVYSELRPIRETAYLVSEHELSMPAPTDIEYHDIAGTVIQPLCRAWENYYHWTAQCLPAMLASIEAGRGDLLALPHLSSRQEESLRLLGLHDFPRFLLHRNRSYGFKDLEVCDLTYGGSSFQISTTVRKIFSLLAVWHG